MNAVITLAKFGFGYAVLEQVNKACSHKIDNVAIGLVKSFLDACSSGVTFVSKHLGNRIAKVNDLSKAFETKKDALLNNEKVCFATKTLIKLAMLSLIIRR